MNLLLDSTVYGAVAATESPSSRNQVLPVIGFSGEHMDVQRKTISGRYQLTGRVIETNDIDRDYPGSVALVLYHTERLGDVKIDSAIMTQESNRLDTAVGALIEGRQVPASVRETPTATRTPTEPPISEETDTATQPESVKQSSQTPTNRVTESSGPGFTGIGVLLALLSIVLLARQRST
jgi:PGF-CTERM protein